MQTGGTAHFPRHVHGINDPERHSRRKNIIRTCTNVERRVRVLDPRAVGEREIESYFLPGCCLLVNNNNPIFADVDCENRAPVPRRGEKNIPLNLADTLTGNPVCFWFRNSNIVDCHLRTIATIRAIPVRQNEPRADLELLDGRDFGRPDRLPELVLAAEAESNILLARRRLSINERKLTTNKPVTDEVAGDFCRVECGVSSGQHFRGDRRERRDLSPQFPGRVNVTGRHGTIGE